MREETGDGARTGIQSGSLRLPGVTLRIDGPGHMYARIATVFFVVAFPWFAKAATIEVSSPGSGGFVVVTVEGRLEYGDIQQFQTKTSGISKAIVAFGSDGGNLAAGLEIGTTIRLKGFYSLVPDGVRCASACALAWLGGAKRYMAQSAFVGFHAAYEVKDGVSTETSAGNALVGAYLNRIGLPDRAVIYLTRAAPTEMAWLTMADAAQLGIDVELFTMPANTPQASAPPQVQSSPPAAVLTMDEASIADRLAQNFDVRYKEAGLVGLNVSISACYDQARSNRKLFSAEYCVALDFLTSRVDFSVTQGLKVEQLEFNRYPSAQARATSFVSSMEFGAETPELVQRAQMIADRAMASLVEGQSQSSAPPPATGVIPALSGLKIGDPASNTSRIGLAPVARNQTGPFTAIKWEFPDGNELSATVSAGGSIVYLESDWGEKQTGTIADYPGLKFGETTLSQIRQIFGSNGFSFAQHGGVVKVRDGLVLINSYEVGAVVATFVTKIAGRQINASMDAPGNAVLVALSIADAEYANSVWGKRTYDPNYRKIEWK